MEDLQKIVEYYRAKTAYKPNKISNFSDLKTHPNDILVSYLLEDDKAGLSGEKLENPNLENKYKIISVDELPRLPLTLSYDDSLMYTLPAISPPENVFIKGFENDFLFAKKNEQVYVCPSGKKIGYFLLTDEKSANTSILEGGYSNEKGELFVRENFLAFMQNLFQIQGGAGNFIDKIIAAVLFHELGHIEIDLSGNYTPLDNELASEEYAKAEWTNQGFDIKDYKLFHILRADESGRNVSNRVLDFIENRQNTADLNH